MKSVMTHDFSRIPQTDISRSCFNRSHGVKTAFDSGYLVPFFVDEVLPGDTFDIDATLMTKLMPTVSDFMDNVFVDTQWFYVPSRLLWTNFTKMMGERVNPADSIDFTVPQLTAPAGGFEVQSLADYFGIPVNVGGIKVNALPFRAYAKIWDDWYRDENLQNSIIQSSADLGDGNGTIAWNTLLKRGKRHDYFTSCLPAPQKGAGVELPLGTTAPVVYGSFETGKYGDAVTINSGDAVRAKAGSANAAVGKEGTLSASSAPLLADLSEATAATINSLRMAFQIQRQLELDARGGTRFCEIIRSNFKTICPDARLQRSEYLGGSSRLFAFNPVQQTNYNGDMVESSQAPLGFKVLNGKVFSNPRITKSFTEHGYIIGLVSVRADLNYQQGLNRMWSRQSRFDFYWPAFAHLGEQAVLNKEIYAQGPNTKDSSGNVIDDLPFGYQERYAEYRYHPSIITGKLRSQAANSLDMYHLAQKFTSLPLLNDTFIQDNPPLARVLSVTDEPQVFLDAYIKCICTRPMPTYSVPGLIDHI